jgi:hypothetical protein
MDRTIPGAPNQRRAIRLRLKRPVRIVRPVNIEGTAVNISATGLLIEVRGRVRLESGDRIEVEIPRMDGQATILRKGRIVRVEMAAVGGKLAIDLD